MEIVDCFWCSAFMPVLFPDNDGTKACIGSWKNLFKAQLSNALPNQFRNHLKYTLNFSVISKLFPVIIQYLVNLKDSLKHVIL